jgi:hypothetical protein
VPYQSAPKTGAAASLHPEISQGMVVQARRGARSGAAAGRSLSAGNEVRWVRRTRGAVRLGSAALVLALAACSASDPEPSPRYDGTYVGTRESERPEPCGVTQQHGTTSARIAGGRVTVPLFGPRTLLTGTVGEDGTVRASGIWPNPTGGFPGMTVLNGSISDDVLRGTASDFRCRTSVMLRRSAAPRPPAGTRQKDRR